MGSHGVAGEEQGGTSPGSTEITGVKQVLREVEGAEAEG